MKFPLINRVAAALQSCVPFLRRNRFFLSLGGVLVLGISIGAAVSSDEQVASMVNAAAAPYLFSGVTDLRSVFTAAFMSLLIYHAALAFLGGSLLGVLSPALLFLRGLGVGAALAVSSHSFGTGGLLVSLLVLLPYFLLSSVALILAAKSAMQFSCALCSCFFNPVNPRQLRTALRVFLLFSLITAAVAAALSFLHALSVVYLIPKLHA